jgi:hypothetical protein
LRKHGATGAAPDYLGVDWMVGDAGLLMTGLSCKGVAVTIDMNEAAREVARAIARTQQFAQTRRDRKKVKMLFAHVKRIPRLGRLRLRGPRGTQFEITLAAIAQNLRRLGKLIVRPPPLTARNFA